MKTLQSADAGGATPLLRHPPATPSARVRRQISYREHAPSPVVTDACQRVSTAPTVTRHGVCRLISTATCPSSQPALCAKVVKGRISACACALRCQSLAACSQFQPRLTTAMSIVSMLEGGAAV